MEYPILFLVLGAFLAAMGAKVGGFGYVLVWLGASFVLTGIGHIACGGRIYGKKPAGALPLWSKLLHGPFLVYTWGIWHLVRLFSREEATSRVNDSLSIGRRLLPHEAPEGFANWVDLTAEFDEPSELRKQDGYLCLPILDGGIPTFAELHAAIGRLQPGTTYVHCAQGHGRTGIFALALLFHQGAIGDLDAGLALLRKVRPALNLNPRQKRFVQRYAATLSAKDSPVGDGPVR